SDWPTASAEFYVHSGVEIGRCEDWKLKLQNGEGVVNFFFRRQGHERTSRQATTVTLSVPPDRSACSTSFAQICWGCRPVCRNTPAICSSVNIFVKPSVQSRSTSSRRRTTLDTSGSTVSAMPSARDSTWHGRDGRARRVECRPA